MIIGHKLWVRFLDQDHRRWNARRLCPQSDVACSGGIRDGFAIQDGEEPFSHLEAYAEKQH